MHGMNLNLSASLNIFKLIANPSLCLPHATVATFDDLPVPLNKAFEGRSKKVDIRAVVLDKDDCFAIPDHPEVHEPYKSYSPAVDILMRCLDLDAETEKRRFEALRAAYPGRRLLIVSNTAGATSYDTDGRLASAVEKATGLKVLPHAVKKPGCGDEIMAYFRQYPETGVTGPHHIAIVGDRLATDMMLANKMGSWGVWVKDGVIPLEQKSIFSKIERRLAPFLISRGYSPSEPSSPFE